jgi:hypothetical protein
MMAPFLSRTESTQHTSRVALLTPDYTFLDSFSTLDFSHSGAKGVGYALVTGLRQKR